jgi:predicted ATP-grasp superfamily ATP-dependent carboligase
METTSPVVVIFRGGYGAVAIARTLGRLGVPLYLVAQEGHSTPVWSSRFWAERKRWDFSRPEEDSVSFLREMGGALQKRHRALPILLTLADWVAVFMERNRDALNEQFVFPQAKEPVLRKLANKWEMHRLAIEHGIPTPATACPASLADVETFLENSSVPIVMKPADPFLPQQPEKGIFASREELMEAVGRQGAEGPLNVVLQEYIPGDADSVWMCNGYFGVRPEHTVTFTGQKLRQISPTGIASLAICLPNEKVAGQTRRLMEAVGYKGCVGIGHRYDKRDGQYKLLDVNARVSGIFRLFAGTNDMDVVRICYLDLTGQRAPATELQPGRKWMLEADVLAAFRAVLGGRLTFREWARSVRGVRELHWWAKDDPAPFLAWLGDRLRQGAREGARRVRKAR